MNPFAQGPFSPCGKTVAFTAASTAPTPVQATNYEPAGMAGQYRVVNAGTFLVFLGVGSTSTQATANSATVTTSGNAIPLLPGQERILSFGMNSYFTGTCTGLNTSAVYITPGSGL
jgi:hypothetical protein